MLSFHLQHIFWFQCQKRTILSPSIYFVVAMSDKICLWWHWHKCTSWFSPHTLSSPPQLSMSNFICKQNFSQNIYSFCSMGQYILILEKCQSWGILDLDLWQCKTSFLFLICFNVVWVALFIFPCTAQISAKYLWFLHQASPPDPPYLPQTAWEDNLYQFVQLPLLALWRVTVRAPTFKKYKTRIHLF